MLLPSAQNIRSTSVFGLAFIFVIAFAQTGWSAITFNVTFNDVVNSTGFGVDDATLGTTRRNTFSSVFSYINSVVDHNGSVDFLVLDSENDGGGFLAGAGPRNFTGPNGFTNGFFFDHATTGTDPFGGVEDARAVFDFGFTWNSDTDAPTGSEYDLYTVSLHEITHTMGFLSQLDASGNGLNGTNPDVFSVYDSFLELGDGTQLFSAGGNYDGTAADLVSGDVFFDGANARAANGGDSVKVYAPGSFADGSSIAHLDNGVDSVMNFSVARGVEKRTYTAIDRGVLADIGWNVSGAAAVPEPSSLAALTISAAVLGLFRRRRRSGGNAVEQSH
jgi:hypothetical protein